MSDEMPTVLEVADKTVYTMAQQGETPAFKVRGQWRFRRADTDAWMGSQVPKVSATDRVKAGAPGKPQRQNGAWK